MLQQPHIQASIVMRNQMRTDVANAAEAAAADPGLRSCGLASFGAREKHPDHFKTCAACRGVAYCSKEHQTEHWPDHKAPCKAARKAAEQRHDA